jgi:hypothetical protein
LKAIQQTLNIRFSYWLLRLVIHYRTCCIYEARVVRDPVKRIGIHLGAKKRLTIFAARGGESVGLLKKDPPDTRTRAVLGFPINEHLQASGGVL